MLLCEHASWSYICHGRLSLVLQTADNIAVAAHHRVKAYLGNAGGFVFVSGSHGRIHHIGPFEEFGVCRAGHQTGHRDVSIPQLFPQRVGKGIEKGFGAIIDGLKAARNEADDRSRDQNPPRIPPADIVANLVHQINSASDIGVDDRTDFAEILIEKGVAKAAAGVRQQRILRSVFRRRVKLVHPFGRRQICPDGLNVPAQTTE
jgi:hypothetical protein